MDEQNRKVVIWGVTSLGKYLVNHIMHENRKWKPRMFVENNPELHNTYINNVPVVAFDDLGKMGDLKEIVVLLAVRNAKNIFQILEQLDILPVSKIGIVKREVLLSGTCIDPWGADENIIWSVDGEGANRIMPYIEVNLIDACNLKCKGCTHFSSLYKDSSRYPLHDYENDLLKLRNIGKVFRLRLLGGEPFLLENLDQYIKIARDIFGESTIEIVTNGLLITKADKGILDAIRDNSVCIEISLYPPTHRIKKRIEACLQSYSIMYSFDTGNAEKEIIEFYRSFTLQNTHDAEVSHSVCSSAACTFLRKGRLYKCPFDGLVNDFYSYYGIDRKYEGGIDLNHNAVFLYEQIKGYALKSIELCSYCSEKTESIPWTVKAEPSMHDWLYQEGK